MRPEDAQIGVRVRVVECPRIPRLRGEVGTIERTYTSSGRKKALHVLLEDDSWQLLWPQEVEPVAH